MDAFHFLLILAALAVAAALAWLAREMAALRRAQGADQAPVLLQQQVEALRGQLQQSLTDLAGTVSTGLTQQATLQQTLQVSLQGVDQTSRQVVKELAQVQAGTLRVEELGKSLNSLQEILKPTKQRGEMGEVLLRNILDQALPAEHVAYQHAFRSGARVDAVVRCPQGLVPIDAKFPMESFQRLQKAGTDEERARCRQEFRKALRTQVDEIADKYLCPDEGTLDFAFMYIPAEGIYYELAVTPDYADLVTHARKRRVIPVSPNTLFAYLQTVLMGLKGMRIEAEAKAIREGLARVQGDLQKVLVKSATLGDHLRKAVDKHQEIDKEMGGLGTRIGGMAGGAREADAGR